MKSPGILTKDGAGRLILGSPNSYTEGTTINGGILQIGTATVPVNYNANASGPLSVSITPADVGASGLAPLQVYGTATLAGSLTVSLGASSTVAQYEVGQKYQIVTVTQGISGGFSSVGLTGSYAPYLSPAMGYGQVNTSQARLGGGVTSGYKTMTRHGALTAWVGLGGLATIGNTHAKVAETIGSQTYNLTTQIAPMGLFRPSAGVQLVGKRTPWKLAAVWHGQIANRTSAQVFMLEGSYKF